MIGSPAISALGSSMVETSTKFAGSKKALILVCGAARSGTTMLDLMLGNSPDVFSYGEIYALFRPFRTHHFFGSSGTASQVEQGASKIQREPGFPSEFMTEFDRITQKSGSDRQLEEIINRLKACETASIVNLDMTKQVSPSIRPLWYYRHTLKAIIRRYFPERQAVIK
jgi:hypothetical protein